MGQAVGGLVGWGGVAEADGDYDITFSELEYSTGPDNASDLEYHKL